jgi:hypothetical protein
MKASFAHAGGETGEVSDLAPLTSAADDEAYEGPRLPLSHTTKQPRSLSKEWGPLQILR